MLYGRSMPIMKIHLLSDLHLSVHALDVPETNADVVVLAGDIWRPKEAVSWAQKIGKPTLYVAGNHEFYGGDLITTMQQLRLHAAGTPVKVLEKEVWYHKDVRFLGCTLWSSYTFFESFEQREDGLREAREMMRDFSRISVAPDFEDKFTPAISQLLFESSVDWLESRFREPFAGKTVVITHFAPTSRSVSPQFQGSQLNACFVSELDECISRWQPDLWLHGHTHDTFDYSVGKTRVLCNARGYARDGQPENSRFNPGLVLEV